MRKHLMGCTTLICIVLQIMETLTGFSDVQHAAITCKQTMAEVIMIAAQAVGSK